jgi:hypothetical protein
VGVLSLDAITTASSSADHLDLELIARNFVDRTSLAGTTVALQADVATHCLARFDISDRCHFRGIRRGAWQLTVQAAKASRLGPAAMPLPSPTRQLAVMAATGPATEGEVMRVLSPGRELLLILSLNDDEYSIEISRVPSSTASVAGVEYGLVDGARRLLFVPLPASPVRSSAKLRLSGLDDQAAWQVVEAVDDEALRQGPVEDVVESIRSTDSSTALAAWRDLLKRLPRPYEEAVSQAGLTVSSRRADD